MFARIARYDVGEDRIEEAIDAFREAASQLGDLNGLRGGYVFANAEDEVLISLTLWDSRAAMDTSEVRAARLRQEAVKQVEGSVASVHTLEVAFEIGAGVKA